MWESTLFKISSAIKGRGCTRSSSAIGLRMLSAACALSRGRPAVAAMHEVALQPSCTYRRTAARSAHAADNNAGARNHCSSTYLSWPDFLLL